MGDSGGGGYFRGTSKDQDTRFADKEKKMIKSMKFPPEFNTKIDMKKVKLEVMKPWITKQITELLGFEDEVLIGYVFSLLEEKENPDPRILQVNITGFLETDSSTFVLKLWKLLISAQNSPTGIPPEFLERKKREIQARKAESERIKAELAKKLEQEEKEKAEMEKAARQEIKREEESEKVDLEVEGDEFGRSRDRREERSRRSRSRDRSRDRERKRSHRDRSRERHRRHSRERRRDYSRERRRDHSRERRRRRSPDSSDEERRERKRHHHHNHRSSKRHRRSSSREDERSVDTKNSKDSSQSEEALQLEKELREKALASLRGTEEKTE